MRALVPGESEDDNNIAYELKNLRTRLTTAAPASAKRLRTTKNYSDGEIALLFRKIVRDAW